MTPPPQTPSPETQTTPISTQTSPSPATPVAQSSPFLEQLIEFLMPYFRPFTADPGMAGAEIEATLASYGANTRSQMLNAVQIIAFGFAALDTLAEAKTTEAMSPSMRVRFRGCANNLSRSSQQNEQTLAKRLACASRATAKPASDVSNPAPAASRPLVEPTNDMPDAHAEQALQHAKATIAAYRGQRSGAQSPILPTRQLPDIEREQNNRLWGTAMMNVLAELGMPVQPASTT
jgi:hypothetical protein